MFGMTSISVYHRQWMGIFAHVCGKRQTLPETIVTIFRIIWQQTFQFFLKC